MHFSLRAQQRTQSVWFSSTMHLSLARRQLEHAFCFFSRTRMLGGASLELPSLSFSGGLLVFSLLRLSPPFIAPESRPRFRPLAAPEVLVVASKKSLPGICGRGPGAVGDRLRPIDATGDRDGWWNPSALGRSVMVVRGGAERSQSVLVDVDL